MKLKVTDKEELMKIYLPYLRAIGRKMGVKKPEIIWTFFCKAGLTYAGDRSAVEFPLDVGS